MSADVASERLRGPRLPHVPALEAKPSSVSPPFYASEALQADLQLLYERLVATLRDLPHCSGAALLLPAGAAATVPAQFGPQLLPETIELPATAHLLLSRIEQSRKTLLIHRSAAFLPPLPTPAMGVAWMGVPLLLGNHLHACLSLAGSFRAGDARLAEAIVQQTADALHWWQRAAQAQQQAQQAQQLLDLSQRVRRIRSQATALDQVLEMAMELTAATHSYIVVSQQGRATVVAKRGYSQTEATLLQQIPPSLDRGLTGQAYRTCLPAFSDDIQVDPEALPTLADTHAELVIPIRSDDHVLGLIDLQSPRLAAFQSIDAQWLAVFADLAAAAIEQHDLQPRAPQASQADVVTQHELLLSSRLAVVTDLAAGVAHEINNPLTTILGYTHLLLREQELSQAIRNDIEQIIVEGQRIAALVDRFLRFAQPASSGKQPLAINEPLREALSLLATRLQEVGVKSMIDLPSEPLMVLGQAGQLEQAFLELLQNAIEAMSTAEERKLTITAREQGGWVRVAISDSGRGLMPDLLTRVFEPGFTTKVDKGISRGLGLGLYAAHTIIQDHWGRIEVESQIWQGSTFTVCLPAI